jgi:hypothetical protein
MTTRKAPERKAPFFLRGIAKLGCEIRAFSTRSAGVVPGLSFHGTQSDIVYVLVVYQKNGAQSSATLFLCSTANASFCCCSLGRRQPGSSAEGTMNWNAKDYNEISLNCIWSEHVRAAPFRAVQCTPSRRLFFAARENRPPCRNARAERARVRVLRPASGGEGGEADSKGYQDDVHVQSVLVARAEQRPWQSPYAAHRPNATQGAATPGARRQRRTRPRRAPAAAAAACCSLSLSHSHSLTLTLSSAGSLASQRFD